MLAYNPSLQKEWLEQLAGPFVLLLPVFFPVAVLRLPLVPHSSLLPASPCPARTILSFTQTCKATMINIVWGAVAALSLFAVAYHLPKMTSVGAVFQRRASKMKNSAIR